MTNYLSRNEHAIITNNRIEADEAFNHDRLAYVIEETVEGKSGFSIYSGNGEHLGHLESRDIAFAAAQQYDMCALSVH